MDDKKVISTALPVYERPQLIRLTTPASDRGQGFNPEDCVTGSGAQGACLSGGDPYLACIAGSIT